MKNIGANTILAIKVTNAKTSKDTAPVSKIDIIKSETTIRDCRQYKKTAVISFFTICKKTTEMKNKVSKNCKIIVCIIILIKRWL